MTTNFPNINLLLRVYPRQYIVLPTKTGLSQEMVMHPYLKMRRGRGIAVRDIPQKDGSLLRVLQTQSQIIHSQDITLKVRNFNISGETWFETYLTLQLYDMLQFNRIDPKYLKYVGYITHYFEDSFRFIPIILDSLNHTFYNMSKLFLHLTPEDEFGVLLHDKKQIDDLEVPGVGKIVEIIEYIAGKRLCPTCGTYLDFHSVKKEINTSKRAKLRAPLS